VSPRPTPKLEDHTMSAVCNCLFNIFATTLHIKGETFQTRINCCVWEVKGKVVPVLLFNSGPRHEGVLGEWSCISTQSLTSTLDGGEWSSSRPGRFTPRERDPSTHWIGGWMGPRAVLNTAVKRKIPSPHRESKNPDLSARSRVLTD
jgi:hypothetical protein